MTGLNQFPVDKKLVFMKIKLNQNQAQSPLGEVSVHNSRCPETWQAQACKYTTGSSGIPQLAYGFCSSVTLSVIYIWWFSLYSIKVGHSVTGTLSCCPRGQKAGVLKGQGPDGPAHGYKSAHNAIVL